MAFQPRVQPLAGRAVFLSASVPSPERAERYRRIPEAFARVEQAVLRVASAVFNAGGSLVFGGHPSISPLVGYLCTQYQPPPSEPGESAPLKNREPSTAPRVFLWQSQAFRGTWAEPSKRLAGMPGVSVYWTPAADGERFDPDRLGERQCPVSLEIMRHSMINESKPVAMVAVGGMEGVEEEFSVFRQFRKTAPVYALPTTGGAAEILFKNHCDAATGAVRSFDAEVKGHVLAFRKREMEQERIKRKKLGGPPLVDPDDGDVVVIPYANVAIRTVEDIVRHLGGKQ